MKEIVKTNQGKLTLGVEKSCDKVFILGIDKNYQNNIKEGEEWEFKLIKEFDLKKKDKYGNNLFLKIYKPIKRVEKFLFKEIKNNCGIFSVISGNRKVKEIVIKPEIKEKVTIFDNGIVIYESYCFKLPNEEEQIISKDRKFYSFEQYPLESLPIKNKEIEEAYKKFLKKKEEQQRKEQEKLNLLKEIPSSFPPDLVLHFLKHSVKQLTKSEVDYTAPLLGQEEELFESGSLRWKLEIAMMDEDFIEWEKAVTNAEEVKDSNLIQKLQDMAMFAILKEIKNKLSLPFFVSKEVFKNISRPEPEQVHYDVLPCGKDDKPLPEEIINNWKREQKPIVEQKKKEAEKGSQEIKQENEYLSVVWKPEVNAGISLHVQDLEKNRGFASFLVTHVIVEWKPDIKFKVEIANDVKKAILEQFEVK